MPVRLLLYCAFLWAARMRGSEGGREPLPFLLPILFHCGPQRRGEDVPSLFDCLVSVPEGWRSMQPDQDLLLIDLGRLEIGRLPEDNPFRVLLEVLDAVARRSREVFVKLGGFARTIVADPVYCDMMADVLLHAFFLGDGSGPPWFLALSKQELKDLMMGKVKEERMELYYEGVSNYDELVRSEGRQEGRVEVMASLLGKRFGESVARTALPIIKGMSDPAVLEDVDDLLLKSPSGDDFLERLKGVGVANGGG